MTRGIVIVAAITALMIAVIGIWYVRAERSQTAPDRPAAGTQQGEALIGGPFSLVNQDGARVTEADFAGRYTLVYFGYTYCPDFCPMSLSTMTAALDLLAPAEAERIVPVFITVDPERDTVEHLKDYAPLFGPRLVTLTGTAEETGAAARAYRVYHNRVRDDRTTADYLVDHSTFTYLMGPDGRYVTHFGHDVTPEAMAERLRGYLASA